MIQDIILISLIIIIFFFISNGEKINTLISKKYIKYLLVLLIIYFIYQKYNIVLLVILILIFVFLNIENNKYILKFESFKNLMIDYFNNYKETFANDDKKIDFEPYKIEEVIEKTDVKKEKAKIEPFKEEVTKLKDLYENIKLEIKRLK
jgi:hypothetical protein